ncbi:MAG TPA: hypothetical protein VMT08_19050 [Bradyrhizobium sp.]|nr:hypothetical protein [Bradyrhizobium sp.]
MARANKVTVASGADLPDRIVQLMTNARYASFVVRGDSDRTVFLPEIISLHTRRELSEIDGIGRASIAKIQTWLAQQGRRLRRPGESIDSVICHFGVRRKDLHPHKRPLLPAITPQPDATLAPALQNSDSKADAAL